MPAEEANSDSPLRQHAGRCRACACVGAASALLSWSYSPARSSFTRCSPRGGARVALGCGLEQRLQLLIEGFAGACNLTLGLQRLELGAHEPGLQQLVGAGVQAIRQLLRQCILRRELRGIHRDARIRQHLQGLVPVALADAQAYDVVAGNGEWALRLLRRIAGTAAIG